MAGGGSRLTTLLRRLREPGTTPDEQQRLAGEVREEAAKATPPHRKAERRPQRSTERR